MRIMYKLRWQAGSPDRNSIGNQGWTCACHSIGWFCYKTIMDF